MLALKYKFLIDKAFTLLSVTPTPFPDKKYQYINSVTSDINVNEKDYGLIGEWIEEGLAWIGDKLLDLLEPFVNWGSRIIIISCFIIFFCSQERKYISLALKWGIIFTLFWVVRSAIK